MTIGFYMDVNAPYAITDQLRLREADVLAAQEDNAGQCVQNRELIAKATELSEWVNRVEYLPFK